MAKEFAIDELRQLLSSKLTERQKELRAELDSIDAEIAQLNGTGRSARTPVPVTRKRVAKRTGRKLNGPTLKEAIYAALGVSKKPLTIADLAQAVLERGYKTKSTNLKNIVSQAVYTDPNVKRAGKGKFRVKKMRQ